VTHSDTDSEYVYSEPQDSDSDSGYQSESMGKQKMKIVKTPQHSSVCIVNWDNNEYSGGFVRHNRIYFGDHCESVRPKLVTFYFPEQDYTISLPDSSYILNGSLNSKVQELKNFDPKGENRIWTYDCANELTKGKIKGLKFSKIVPNVGAQIRTVIHWSDPARGGAGRMSSSMSGEVTNVPHHIGRKSVTNPEGFPLRIQYDAPTSVGVCFTPILISNNDQVCAIHVAGDGGPGKANEGLTVAGNQ